MDKAALSLLVGAVTGAATVDLDSKGLVAVFVKDCWNTAAHGVTLEAAGVDQVFYTKGLAVVPGAQATSSDGVAIFVDVPPGTLNIVGYVGGVEVTSHSIQVTAGRAHQVVLAPNSLD